MILKYLYSKWFRIFKLSKFLIIGLLFSIILLPKISVRAQYLNNVPYYVPNNYFGIGGSPYSPNSGFPPVPANNQVSFGGPNGSYGMIPESKTIADIVKDLEKLNPYEYAFISPASIKCLILSINWNRSYSKKSAPAVGNISSANP